jgi:hypothetical protein
LSVGIILAERDIKKISVDFLAGYVFFPAMSSPRIWIRNDLTSREPLKN